MTANAHGLPDVLGNTRGFTLKRTPVKAVSDVQSETTESTEATRKLKHGDALLLAAVAAVWFGIVITTVAHHEYWRDEVRALSIATAPPTLWQLPAYLKDEGHPVLWYILLRVVHAVSRSALVLPITSITVAALAMVLFLYRAPFSLGLKFLFVFSVLPIYEYSVMARNYGISMLLMFCFATLYGKRRKYPLILASVLALLANCNFHSLILAALLTMLWLQDDFIVQRQTLSTREQVAIVFGVCLVALAGGFSLITVLPDDRSVTIGASAEYYWRSLLDVLRHPYNIMNELVPVSETSRPGHLLQFALIASLVAGLFVRPAFGIVLAIALLTLGTFFVAIYPGKLRHQGLLLIFAITLYWICKETSSKEIPSAVGPLRMYAQAVALAIALPTMLVAGDWIAYGAVTMDLTSQLSSAKALGVWLKRAAEPEAIVVGEPDFNLEALPYYAPQRIYIPREDRFRQWVSFTTEAKAEMSLGELLRTAQRLKREQHVPVYIALGFPTAQFRQNKSISYSYNKMLTWDQSQWEQFRVATQRVAGFWKAVGDENFDLYEVL